MAMESKMEIYEMIPKQHIPKTILAEVEDDAKAILEQLSVENIKYPFIAKPDIGMKAFGVSKIWNEDQFYQYMDNAPRTTLIQELIPFHNEVGISYIRYPDETKGKITAMVGKEFLSVVGDGKQNLLRLIKNNPRSYFQLNALKKRWGDQFERVPDEGEEIILVPYGSHTRGAKFIDMSTRINNRLNELIDTICQQVDGFHYGRLDILYNDFEELCQGKNFKIIEINGAGGEPTHIYDPKHSIWFAWKEITRHWNHLNKISIINHKKGYPYLTNKEGKAMLRENDILEQQLKHI